VNFSIQQRGEGRRAGHWRVMGRQVKHSEWQCQSLGLHSQSGIIYLQSFLWWPMVARVIPQLWSVLLGPLFLIFPSLSLAQYHP
jgi:hypothetical protein